MSLSAVKTHWTEEAWERISERLERMRDSIGVSFPNGGKDGRYDRTPSHDWVSGFWPGLLWLVYQENGDAKARELAEACEREIAKTLWEFELLHHDVGFMFGLSSVFQYKLTGDEEARRHGLMAASLLAGRFNPVGRFIRAWPNWGGEDHSGWAIIDCMMNLPLLYWASREIDDPRYRHVAEMHADTVLREFILSDGSAHHIVGFDPETGERIEAKAGQGHAADSAWARGAAWALYGFTLSHEWTGRERFLRAAERIAEFFLGHLPDDLVPYWDFKLPEAGPDTARDTSAAAIAASGLLDLAAALPGEAGERYLKRAEEILFSLHSHYSAGEETEEGLLLRGTGYHDADIYVDAPLIYGDYYYAEALLKLRKSVGATSASNKHLEAL